MLKSKIMTKISNTLKDNGFTAPFKMEISLLKEASGCDQCEMLMVNGVPTHEQGCPNAKKNAPKKRVNFENHMDEYWKNSPLNSKNKKDN